MSTALPARDANRVGRRGAVLATLALVAVAVLALSGGALPTARPLYQPDPVPTVGRTSAVCAVDPDATGPTTLTAVGVQTAPGRTGTLTARPLGASADSAPLLRLTTQGRSVSATDPRDPVVLTGEGVLAVAGAAALVASNDGGNAAGLAYQPCGTPATSFWFAGVGARDDDRTTLLLSNPDDSQAEVDLSFYGPSGHVVVPGSPGLVIPAQTARSVALQPLVDVSGPLTVHVRSTKGRVAAAALDQAGGVGQPAGFDWHAASVAPARRVLIPGVPPGNGARTLVVANPGQSPAQVSIEALGQDSAYVPAGAESVQVAPGSSATLDLGKALGGSAAVLRLTSTADVTAAVLSSSTREGAASDVAVEAAAAPILRTAVAPVGLLDGADSSVILGNDGTGTEPVSLEVLGPDAASLTTVSVSLAPGTTALRTLRLPAPGYVVVRARDGAAVTAELVLDQRDAKVAGLSTPAFLSPDVASRAPKLTADPAVGR